MQDELILFRKMQEGGLVCIQFFFRVLLGTVIPLRVRFCREPGGGGRHRAGHVHLFVGESGEDYSFRFSLRLSESFCQEFLY